MKHYLKTLGLTVAFLFSFAGSVQAAGPSALQEVKTTIDKVIAVNEKYPGDANTKVRRDKLREVIQPKFDFDEMSKRSLGTNWQNITPAQQKEFVDVFSDLLAATYLNRVETAKAGMVKVESESVDEPRALVKSTVESKGDKFPLDYKLMNKDGQWRVYDVVIENIGLVANYRNEFAGIMRKDGFDGLMQKLKAKAVK